MTSKSHNQLERLKERYIEGEIPREDYLELKAELEGRIAAENKRPSSTAKIDTDSPDQWDATTVVPLNPGMEIGTTLPDGHNRRYLIGKLLGKGGWGVVFRAQDRKFTPPRDVAVKAIFNTATDDAKALKRIERETRLGMELAHPGVVRIWDFDVYHDIYFLVMELVDGGNLNTFLAEKEGEKLQLSEALPILKDLAEGLDYLHKKGIVHRDLKPSNLLWHSAEKRFKITDFGMSQTARQSILKMTRVTTLISGTDPYMAPEIWDAADPSNAGDFYALGIIAYEILSGDTPFQGPNFLHQHQKIAAKPITGLPDYANNAIFKMLAKSPGDRFSSASDFYLALSTEPFPVCPECGESKDVKRFTCTRCGRKELCQDHKVNGKYCPDCGDKIVDEKRLAEEQHKREVESERLSKDKPTPTPVTPVIKRESAIVQTMPKKSRAWVFSSVLFSILVLLYFAVIQPYQQKEAEDRRRRTPVALTDGPLTGMKFAFIPGGSFQMGSNDGTEDEKPVHTVNIGSFQMMTTEVTQAMWEQVMGDNPSNFKGSVRPVESVSWEDIQEFLKKLNTQYPGRSYRLPTESEWEYACRAGTTTRFSSGSSDSDLDRVGWYSGNSGDKTHPVGQKQPNAWGLYDMHGNVWEWCEDVWHEDYNGAPTDGSAWTKGGNQGRRVLRGGSWYGSPKYCRSAFRGRYGAVGSNDVVGFRLVFA